MARIAIEGLSVSFGGARVIDGLQLEIPRGAFFTLLGPSGCGKTTLLRLLAGLIEPSGGRVEIQGLEPAERHRIRPVFQEHSLFPWLNVIDNACVGLRIAGVNRDLARREARGLFERMGLAGREKSWPGELSTGMKQRVAVIRAFLSNPAMLLMDEPFGAVDAQTRAAMQQELLGLWVSARVPVIFVTHDVEEAILLAQRVIVMEGPPGRIRSEYVIPFGYPRPFEITMSPEFVEIKRTIHADLGMRWEPVLAR